MLRVELVSNREALPSYPFKHGVRAEVVVEGRCLSRKCEALGFILSPVRHQKIKRKGDGSHLFLDETALLLSRTGCPGSTVTGRLACSPWERFAVDSG